ncbi:MAG: hypothetical protein KBC48_02255 [Candidatus Pacebacteria bacterium]|nr:hypothetical protein [Candidatus Paceibacterota bacterium]
MKCPLKKGQKFKLGSDFVNSDEVVAKEDEVAVTVTNIEVKVKGKEWEVECLVDGTETSTYIKLFYDEENEPAISSTGKRRFSRGDVAKYASEAGDL